ncbi:MAG: cobyric acid synthase CobQ [Lentisphaerae bacterium GWF2_52_8]|nr:MAG: cobyric acid synthase CobQ [Lentisphaerae bacterium GWF2_52_8]
MKGRTAEEMSQSHGGDLAALAHWAGAKPEDIMDFSVSINPLGMPETLQRQILRWAEETISYPEPRAESLTTAVSRRFGLPVEMILPGNGATQLIHAIPAALRMKRAVIASPSYGDYERACRNAGMELFHVIAEESDDFVASPRSLGRAAAPDTLLFIGQPGNPAGGALAPDQIRKLAAEHPETIFVVDEAFIDFAPDGWSLFPEIPANIIVIRSLTKFYAIAGLRAGYCVAQAELIRKISAMVPDWSLNSVAIKAGIAALDDKSDFSLRSKAAVLELRESLAGQLRQLGLKVFPSLANYLLVKLPLAAVPERLLKEHHIAVRTCGGFQGLDTHFIRIGIRGREENEFLLESLKKVLSGETPKQFFFARKRLRPSLMLQGTSSDAGKSILTAAFCRVLLQDGYDVAPFKSQNMSLNSYVTPDGGEIGRAQAVQAEACRLDPDVRMNPVLLKPSSGSGAQLVILGKPAANMHALEYHSAKMRFFEQVKGAYDSLASEHQVMLLEGAGSPGEINLKDSDIVNMNMARHAQSPVLLVGDIDRGGTYASFLGHWATFAQWERELLKGFLVNKFRGDASLLKPAHDYIFESVGKPVLGVIPFIKDLRLPAEDSMSFHLPTGISKRPDSLDVALIVLGHTSNFTDFTPLEQEPDLMIRHVRTASELGKPDLIILPGSKNVISDFETLQETGLDKMIRERAAQGTWIVGICGGLQLAGETIADPYGIESDRRSINVLGLLPLRTVLEKEKCLRLTRAKCLSGKQELSGYEIHHGVSSGAEKLVSMRDEEKRPLGFAEGRVWLTYLHGVFDADRFRRDFIDMLRLDRGMKPLGEIQSRYDLEPELNRLADVLRHSVDLKAIYKLMGLA